MSPPSLGATLDRSAIPTWLCDRTTLAILAANASAIARLGWSRDELLASTMHALWSDPSDPAAKLEGAARAGKLVTWQQKAKEGVVEIEAAVTATDDGEGWVVQATAIEPMALARPTRQVLQRLAGLLEHATEGISVFGADGTTEYVSPAVARMLGRTSEELYGTTSVSFTNPEDLARMIPVYRELLREPGGTRTFVARYARSDGVERWIESTITNLLHDPTVRALVAYFRDVTDRVAGERALEDARRRFEYLLSATSAVTYSCSVEPPHHATFISENVVSVFGYSARELLERRGLWADRIHPDDKPLLETSGLFETGRHVYEYRFLHADGTYRWIHDDLVLIRDEQGRPRELIGFFFDVTARREAELALRRSEANFRALIEHAPFAVGVHRDERVVYANPAMLSLLGYERLEEFVGISAFSFIAPSSEAEARRRTRYLAKAGGDASTPLATFDVVRRDGTPVAVEVEGMRLDFDGAPASVVLARDLTERRAMLAQLAASDRLASVGALAAGVAHEINNPLAFIQTNLDLLERELPACFDGGSPLRSADVKLLLRDARQGAERIRALVRDLRTLSHPDRDSITTIDLREVVERCVRMAEKEIRRRARLVTELPREAITVDGNASRLGQVFLNLLVNAAQAIPEGAPLDHVVTVTMSKAEQVLVEVSDTGVGIPAEVLGHVFDPFFTTKPIGLGTGLGLAICHGIVTSHAGNIGVESKPGVGTTFRVRLPPSNRTASGATSTSQTTQGVDSMRLLVIDDEEALGRSLRLLLGREHDVVVVTRARDGLERLMAGETFDVVFCDLMMPEMDGISFYERVQKAKPEIASRVIFLTGGAFTKASREFLQRIPNPCLEKPFELEAMLEAMRAIRATP